MSNRCIFLMPKTCFEECTSTSPSRFVNFVETDFLQSRIVPSYLEVNSDLNSASNPVKNNAKVNFL